VPAIRSPVLVLPYSTIRPLGSSAAGWGFTGGGAGYEPVTFYSEGSVGGLAARCKPWSHELMLIPLLSSRTDPLCLIQERGCRLGGLSVLRPGSTESGWSRDIG
jgi:hypothetical protein